MLKFFCSKICTSTCYVSRQKCLLSLHMLSTEWSTPCNLFDKTNYPRRLKADSYIKISLWSGVWGTQVGNHQTLPRKHLATKCEIVRTVHVYEQMRKVWRPQILKLYIFKLKGEIKSALRCEKKAVINTSKSAPFVYDRARTVTL